EVPSARGGQHLRNRVVPVRSAGAATADTGESHPAAGPEAEAPDRLAGILRTSRCMPAGPANKGRKCVAVEGDEPDGRDLEGQVDPPPKRVDQVTHQASAARLGGDSSLSSASTTA